MMVPRAFAQNPLAQRQLHFSEKDVVSRRKSADRTSSSPPVSTLSQSLSQRALESNYTPHSDPVTIPPPTEQRSPPRSRRPGPSSLQISLDVPNVRASDIPKRRESVQQVLSATTIPSRRKQRPKPAQRLPNCDYVADFSKLLREDVQPQADGGVSGSWSNPGFYLRAYKILQK